MSFQFYESRVFAAILHLIAIAQLFYAMNFDWNLNIPDTQGVPKMLRHGYGGRSRFLTYWCLVSRQLAIVKQLLKNMTKLYTSVSLTCFLIFSFSDNFLPTASMPPMLINLVTLFGSNGKFIIELRQWLRWKMLSYEFINIGDKRKKAFKLHNNVSNIVEWKSHTKEVKPIKDESF